MHMAKKPKRRAKPPTRPDKLPTTPNRFQIYRPDRLAQILDCNPSTIWRMRKKGLLPPFVKIGNIRGLTEEQLQQVLRQRRVV
jgi:hypothetical protein